MAKKKIIYDVFCDKCGSEMEPFDISNYHCDCGRHGYLFPDGHVEYDNDCDPDWMGKDDIDWDDVFDD